MAITAHRIQEITDRTITFKYKDYADKSKVKEMTLSHAEFARRFEQHILPHRHVKIRHSGYLSHQGQDGTSGKATSANESSATDAKGQYLHSTSSMDKDRR
ncbi:MAG: transposase [Saprospiraceae bacterium]|nr:transposase [Candidatus Parvibacillus calidus]